MRLIPAIDLRDGQVVRLTQGDDGRRTRYGVDPFEVVREYAAAGVDLIHVVDLDGALGDAPQRELLSALIAEGRDAGTRIELGGGLSDQDAVAWAIDAGCERVILGSMLARDFERFSSIVHAFPNRVVPAIEVAGGKLRISGWTEEAALSVDDACRRLRGLPCPAVLVTDVERDGTMVGPNLDLARQVAVDTGIPSLLSGGVRSLEDLTAASRVPEIAGAIVGKAIYEGVFTVGEALVACGAPEPPHPGFSPQLGSKPELPHPNPLPQGERGPEVRTGTPDERVGASRGQLDADQGSERLEVMDGAQRQAGIEVEDGRRGPLEAGSGRAQLGSKSWATSPAKTGLTHRIIPCLDVRDGRVVKGVKFKNLRDQGDPAESAERYAAQGADEIVFLDITASPEGRDADRDWIRRTAERVFIPLSVGGGVRCVEDAEKLLRSGADKVGVNTAAISNPDLIDDLAQRFGSQCVVLSVDALGDGAAGWEVVTHGGRQRQGRDAVEWILEGIDRGAGEILLTSIDSDGTRDGYDLELLRQVCPRVEVPVIASGGAGRPEHLADALRAGAAAVLAASIFHQGTYTVGEIKAFLANEGFPVREENLGGPGSTP